ncbi:Multicopper oxidase type 2 [Penicillium maclennaniae]|uniref:Multicopper oxidase type 2 n=1 Tax=Penicillium maclennaniae TaxID=1343394 RepID=UPI0025400FB5|nr:Multicopper oxidase type 2 [Penicillium maclennaniae]KAJ5665202.1 Multicopper oxidase type 2 [Penicillium maclennaniae]
MGKFNFLLLASLAGKLVAAKDVFLDWNITWVNASPDGFERPVIGINGQWPCPQIDVDLGDRLIVDVYNGLGNQSTGIHWHGFHQYATGVMDGSSGVTQCPLPPGSHMQYHFDINQTGTYWYHSHNMAQYPDGFRGPLIVHDPKVPFHFDDEFTITLTDWYHRQMPDLLNEYESEQNEAAGGLEPVPNSALINDASDTKIKVLPNKTYLVHVICTGNWPGHAWVFDGHEMTVVEVDGIYTEPTPVGDKLLRIATGQRVSVLIHTKPDASQNFAIWDTMDINMMFIFEGRDIPAGYNPNATAWLVYDDAKPLPPPPVIYDLTPDRFIDDVSLVPLDKEPLLEPVQHQIIIDTYSTEIDGIKRFTVNNKTYIPQKVPTLYTANTIGAEFSSNPEVYGQVNPFVVKYGEIVEIVINNHHNNLHPWHLHGHQFQVLQRTEVDGGYFTGLYKNVSHTPIRRDTIMVQNHGHVVMRFRADNPGVWLLHCHVEWHVEAGLMATIIEAPETFPQSEHAPPQSHYDACAAYPDPSYGNAAGKEGLDLTGANTNVSSENYGAMYPPGKSSEASAPSAQEPQSTTSAPSAPAPTQQTPPPPAQEPQSTTSAPSAPAPTQQAPPPRPTLQQASAPKPVVGQAPAPESQAAPKPSAQPVEAVQPSIYASQIESNGSWPQPQTGHNHAQVGDGSDGPADIADTQDTKGVWPSAGTDKSYAQVGGKPGEEPIEVANIDTKGLWPSSQSNDQYIKEGGQTYHQHDDGPNDLPNGYEYWQQYE